MQRPDTRAPSLKILDVANFELLCELDALQEVGRGAIVAFQLDLRIHKRDHVGDRHGPLRQRGSAPEKGARNTMHFLLLYDVVDDYVDRRGPFRAEHLSLIQKAHDRGELVMAGALADPADGAVLVFSLLRNLPNRLRKPIRTFATAW